MCISFLWSFLAYCRLIAQSAGTNLNEVWSIEPCISLALKVKMSKFIFDRFQNVLQIFGEVPFPQTSTCIDYYINNNKKGFKKPARGVSPDVLFRLL